MLDWNTTCHVGAVHACAGAVLSTENLRCEAGKALCAADSDCKGVAFSRGRCHAMACASTVPAAGHCVHFPKNVPRGPAAIERGIPPPLPSSSAGSMYWEGHRSKTFAENLGGFATARHVYFSHMYKTGGTTLLTQVYGPLCKEYNISCAAHYGNMAPGSSNKTRVHTLGGVLPAVFVLRSGDRPRFVYGHFVRYGFHEQFESQSYRYVVMVRNPIWTKLSLYYHQRALGNINSTLEDYIDSVIAKGVKPGWSFLPRFDTQLQDTMISRYLVLVNEWYDESVALLHAALGFRAPHGATAHVNTAANHLAGEQRKGSDATDLVPYSALKRFQSSQVMRAEFTTYRRCVALFDSELRFFDLQAVRQLR